ncbi:MAG: NIPSNAP family protein [Acidobacteriota bacterium]|nr:NIPSNAP family protein [Acidobacteriota bacterium]
MPGMTRRRAAKCFGDCASQYTMISFHLPPIGASAAVSGHPPTGLGRPMRVWLPAGAFLMELIGQIIFLPDKVTDWIIPYCLRVVMMIVEVRSYRIKPGRRAEFIEFFETRAVPALRSHGMKILGPLLDIENPNKFVWLRSFPSLDERERMKTTFYEGEL